MGFLPQVSISESENNRSSVVEGAVAVEISLSGLPAHFENSVAQLDVTTDGLVVVTCIVCIAWAGDGGGKALKGGLYSAKSIVSSVSKKESKNHSRPVLTPDRQGALDGSSSCMGMVLCATAWSRMAESEAAFS